MGQNILIKATLRIKPVYTCDKCGNRATGDTRQFETYTGKEVARIQTMDLRTPAGMPIGWASHGRYKYTCPTCNNARKNDE